MSNDDNIKACDESVDVSPIRGNPKVAELHQYAEAMFMHIANECPPDPRKQTALMKVEEASFWATKIFLEPLEAPAPKIVTPDGNGS